MNFHTIVTCINFVDYLEFTYTYNKKVLQNLTILSSTSDKSTEEFCDKNNIYLYQTDIFFKNNNPINRAAATNEFLLKQYQRIQNDEWILFCDADTIITQPVSSIEKLMDHSIPNTKIISCPRKIYVDYSDYPDGSYFVEDIGFFGYFQFFHKQVIMSEILKGVPPLPEYSDVSQHDIKFVNKYWPSKEQRIYLSDCHAIHCGNIGKHWQGRKYD